MDFPDPTILEQVLADNFFWIIILLITYCFFFWICVKMRPKTLSITIPQYDIWKEIKPAQMAYFLSERFDNYGLTATLIHLAQKKFLTIEMGEKNATHVSSDEEKKNLNYNKTFLRKKVNLLNELDPYETFCLNKIFFGEDIIQLGDLVDALNKKSAYGYDTIYHRPTTSDLYEIEKQIRRWAIIKKYWRITWRKYIVLVLMLVSIFVFIFSTDSFLSSNNYEGYLTLLIIVCTMIGFTISYYYVFYSNLSISGHEIKQQISGLRLFLKSAPADDMLQIMQNTNANLDIIFPYTIALGVVHSWSDKNNYGQKLYDNKFNFNILDENFIDFLVLYIHTLS